MSCSAGSLSARRAWIEIVAGHQIRKTAPVALRKESVDRNMGVTVLGIQHRVSLSARRAWIEIASCWRVSGRTLSLSARRAWIEICCGAAVIAFLSGRSPQGERG